MLEFFSAATRAVNPQRAVMECLETAFMGDKIACDAVIINSAMGHPLQTLSQHIKEVCPNAIVLATSCAGVVGKEGPGESMRDIALMALRGEGFVVGHVEGLYGENSFEKGVELAKKLVLAPYPVRMLYLLASGIDIANDQIIAGIESILGPDVVIFGATSSDEMKGKVTFQAVDGVLFQHAAFAVGIYDPTLTIDTQATHGFLAMGEPMTVTAARGNRIFELDHRPAWPYYLERLDLPPNATVANTIPIGALAETLPEARIQEYGNPHILRVVTHSGPAGELVYATTCAVGTQLQLTIRDEGRIFADMDKMMQAMVARNPSQTPVAVFHADCLARGKRLFNSILKQELVNRMQHPLSNNGEVPPWLGMYGFGEYARLGGRNTYHNYTTAIAALYRR